MVGLGTLVVLRVVLLVVLLVVWAPQPQPKPQAAGLNFGLRGLIVVVVVHVAVACCCIAFMFDSVRPMRICNLRLAQAHVIAIRRAPKLWPAGGPAFSGCLRGPS